MMFHWGNLSDCRDSIEDCNLRAHTGGASPGTFSNLLGADYFYWINANVPKPILDRMNLGQDVWLETDDLLALGIIQSLD
jgi:hypothetical protein